MFHVYVIAEDSHVILMIQESSCPSKSVKGKIASDSRVIC